ncbi:MAG: SusC/RagA family TonB-linked outer membrane protein [Bacteroidota bacterium]
MKRKGQILKSTLLSVFLILFVSIMHAQERNITGNVTDENGEAVPGVSIIVSGTATGTISGADGSYSLTVPADATHLMFSFIGMTTQQIEIGDQTTIDATLAEDAIGLDEVVVIGYGTARKQDLTGAIVNVQAEEFEKYKPGSVSDMLRSAVPGLQVGYSTSARNVPDFEVRGDITIKSDDDDERSANRPLIVLDGVIFNGDLAEINVNDVESVDVLKDASAASIYGSRASNGVIVFTTKKGTLGKPVIRVSAKTGFVTGARRLNTFKAGDEVMGWLTNMNEAKSSLMEGELDGTLGEYSRFDKYEDVPGNYQPRWLEINGIPGETNPDLITGTWLDGFGFELNEKENYLNGTSYDWQDFLFKTGVRQDYDVSISGRTDKVSYYWSMGYIDSESVQVGESFSTITSRLNIDVAATDWLNLGINTNFAYQDEGQEPVSNGAYRTASPYDMPWVNGTEGIVLGELNLDLRDQLKDAGAGSNRGNPFLEPAWTTRRFDRYSLFPTMYAKLKLPFGITFTSNFTQRINLRKRFEYEDSANPNWGHGGWARRRHNETYEWQSDNILNWNKTFGEHKFAVTGLANAERNQSWETTSSTSNFSPTEALGYHGMAFGLIPGSDSDDQATSRTALMGRVNYDFGNRYYLSASIRRDGYSRFGVDNVYATFPSVSGAWNITNENFMANAPAAITFLKLRVSWGVNGNSSGLNSYQAYARLSDNKYLNWDNGYFIAPYLYINRMSNDELSWEKNQAWNLALDYGFWEGRLRGSVDVYTSETTDLLLDKKLPPLTGFDDITTNVGNLRNTGVDLSINTINVQSSNFFWSSSLNVHFNKNEIVSLTGELVPDTDADGNPILDGDGNPVMVEPDDIENGWFIGQSKDVIWDYEIDGVYQKGDEAEAAVFNKYPGDFRIIDQNGDGVLNINDKIYQGLDSNPWYITFRNEVEFKGFDLGVILLAKLGYKGGSDYPFNEDQTYIKNHNWFDLPYWTPFNPINTAARINSLMLSDEEYYQNRSYLRIQNISLGYNLQPGLLSKIKVSRARIAFNIDNAAVFTSWIQGDPESQREMPRTYSLSLDFSF